MKQPIVLLLLACLVAGNNHAQTTRRDIHWEQFMDRQALIWDSISPDYYTGMLLGNGLMGANIYEENDHAIRFDVGRSDVTDQRPHIDSVFTESLLTHARLPIGRMTLQTNGKIIGAHMRLDIYNAEASGTISTTAGNILFKSFVPANDHVIYIEATGSGGEKDFSWKWIGEQSVSPRVANSGQKLPFEYQPNPPFQIKDSAGYGLCYQRLFYRGEYATAWKEKSAGARQTMVIATGYSPDKTGIARAAAISAINNFCKKGLPESTREHSGWWHRFYQQSFVSLPDGRMQSFYWTQLYKLASATRPGKPMADLMGPWFTSHTPWPGVWWNLNTELIYSPIFTSNHLELGRSLYQAFNNNLPNLIKNVPAAWQYDAAAIGRVSSYDLVSPLVTDDLRNGRFEPGDLAWALFYYYQYYAYSLDSRELRTKIFPVLQRSVNYLIHLLQKDEQGIYHLPVSFSPEYKDAADANYTLSSLRWGLQTLLYADSACNLHSPEKDNWERVLQNLVPFPVDSTGFMIGKDVDLTESHRHYSHLLMIYPYHLINWAQPSDRQVIETSVRHWLSMKSALAGFSYSGAASLYAAMGKGDTAYAYLNDLLTRYVKPNTLYREAGPVMETPLSAGTSLLEMLLQSWGGKIRVFPALPAQWKDVSFDRLRAEGAFLVSAQTKNGVTESIVVKSIKGGKCVVRTSMTDIRIRSDRRREMPHSIQPGQEKGWSDVQFNCVPGETIVLYRKGISYGIGSIGIGPVKQTIFPDWRWGLHRKVKDITAQPIVVNPRTDKKLLKDFQNKKLGLMLSFMVVHTPETGDAWAIGHGTPKRVADSIALAWDPVNFNANKIIDFAIRAGCKYIVVIAKHHDGFGIWNSKYSDFDVKRLRFKKDILKELGEECHRRGLLFGIYYSIADLHYTGWNAMPTAQDRPPEPKGGKAAFVAFCQNQVKELVTRYDPDIMWFDGYWLGPVWDREDGKQLYSFIKSIKSNILTTRLSSVKDSTGHGFFATDGSSGDYFSYEAKTTDAPSFPWEACTSITYPVYAYEPNAKMLSKKELVTMFDKVICGNGNLVLSIGPKRTGELPEKHMNRFLEFSDWVKANREAVYHTSGGPFRQGAWGGSTYKGNRIYLHLREPANDIRINTLAGYEITAAKDLATGKDLEIKKEGDGYTISTPIFSDSTLIAVVALKLNKQYIFTGWQGLIQ